MLVRRMGIHFPAISTEPPVIIFLAIKDRSSMSIMVASFKREV